MYDKGDTEESDDCADGELAMIEAGVQRECGRIRN